LAQRHPEMVFDLELTDRIPDVLYEGLDCAIQLENVFDDRVVARKLGDLRFYPCASPEYVRRHGEPMTPDDLEQHHCLAIIVPKTGRYREWLFEKDGKTISKQLSGRVNVNSGAAMLAAVLAGEGIGMLGSYTVAESVKAGRLKVLLKPYATKGPGVWLLYPERRNFSPKLRLFIDFVQALFEGVPTWDREVLES
jgi:LysR family transcriptional regulator for bpeEF and oprC